MPVITSNWNETIGALSALSAQIQAHVPTDATFLEQWGWNQPALNRQDVTDQIQKVIERINSCKELDVSDQALIDRVIRIPQTINYISANTIQNFNGNAVFAYLTVKSLLESVIQIIEKIDPRDLSWEAIQDRKLIPAQLKKRLDTLSAGIAMVEKQQTGIADKIKVIHEAHQAANSLPASLSTLEEAKNKYEKSKEDLDQIRINCENSHKAIEEFKDKVSRTLLTVHEMANQIDGIKSAAERQGLGKSFEDRASSLRLSTYILMALLASSLILAGAISHYRILFVEKLLDKPDLDLQVLWANVVLTGFGVAAPIWFAWLLTKQIGQRFRLAEDYGFKSSIAKAYEGYRRETQEIGDPELQRRLLGITLDKVEHPPLAHISKEDSSSPFHDLIAALIGRRQNQNQD